MKRFISILMVFCILVGMCSLPALAEQKEESKTVYLNVAENKPVTAGSLHESFPLSNLVDGRAQTLVIPESYQNFPGMNYENDWFVIDLLHRCAVTRVELYGRMDGIDDSGGRCYFEVQGSNDAEFDSYTVLDKMEEADETRFSEGGCFSFDLDGSEFYRYIRLQRTKGAGSYAYSEFKVFAVQTVTQVPIVSAEASGADDIFTAERCINGRNADGGDAWIAETESDSQYYSLRVDLGGEKHIGMLELEDRYGNANTSTRQGWLIYGSDTYKDDTLTKNLPSLDDFNEYKKLARIGHYVNYYDWEEFPFPVYPGGAYQVALDDSEAYQYITLKKDYHLPAALGQIKAFAVAPQIINSVCDEDEKTIILTFSDEMDTSVTDGVFIATSAEGDEYELGGEWEDAYTCLLDAGSLDTDEKYTLTVKKALKNSYGISMAEDYVDENLSFDEIIVYGIDYYDISDGTEQEFTDFANCSRVKISADVKNNTKSEQSVMMALAIYGENGALISVALEQKEFFSGKKTKVELEADISINEGDKIKFMMWDGNQKPLKAPAYEKINLNEIYVAPYGSDLNIGTEASPVATIKRAQELVRERNDLMTEDINVYIASGVYEQNETLVFDERDSGTEGYNVNYIGEEGAVISGGRKISGFVPAGDGVYSADVTDADIKSIRELYVNGKKAERAQSEQKIKPKSLYEENGERLGFVISGDDMPLCENPSDIQLHWARSWRSLVLNVEEIKQGNSGDVILIMEQPEFNYASAPLDEGFSFWVDETNSFYVENAMEFMDCENEFYFDKKARKLYYKTDSVDMTNAEVYVPMTEKLIEVSGSNLANKVKNITFSGLTFSHTSYDKPDEGYLGDQAQRYETLDYPDNAYPLNENIVGAAIRVSAAENIEFRDNIFMGIASVGLGLYDGAKNTLVEGNVFYDINDSAMTIGLPSDAYMQEETTLGNEVALFADSIASVESKHYYACYANDGDATTGWSGGATNGSHLNTYWQVDLGKEYKISTIRIKSRPGYSHESTTRRHFEVVASNDPTFAESTRIAYNGATPYSFENGFEAKVTVPDKFRYVRIRKTINEYFYLSDVEIYTSDEEFIPRKEVCKDNIIRNNYITRIGQYNWGAPGIQAYYTDGLQILNNTIRDVPYSGICLGWGWTATSDSVTSKNNIISNNFIENYNLVNFDGGGIYTLGQQPGSVISGNYIKNQVNGHAAFYPDSGSSRYTFTGNVLENTDMAFFVYGSYQSYLTVTENYANTEVYLAKSDTSKIEAPIFYLPNSGEPAKVTQIKNNAGLQSQYKQLENLVTPTEEKDFLYYYSNSIEENRWNIGALQDPKYLEYYLENLIKAANSMLDEAKENNLNADKITAFETAISKAEKAYSTAKKQITQPTYKDGVYYGGMTMDRTAVAKARYELKKAIDDFIK